MHSKIFQISNKPISEDYHNTPGCYYDHAGWADYIGKEVANKEDREEYISRLATYLDGVFTLNDDNSLTYNGLDALRKFLDDWAEYLRFNTSALKADNVLARLYSLKRCCMDSHKECRYRFYIADWNGYAGPLEDLLTFTESELKQGDRIYVGSIVDYHY